MENITIKINGREVSAPQGSTILEAARLAQIEIPTLCYLKEINEIGACRMCVVEVKGARSLVTACVYQSTKEWKFGQIHRRLLRPEERHYSFFYPITIVSVCPVSAVETVNFRPYAVNIK